MNRRALLLLTLALLLPVDAATAHAPFEGAGSFYGGLLHPLFVPAHAIAVMGMGLLVGQQAPRWRWRWPAPASYVVGLGVGFAAMISAVAPGPAEEILLAATAACGALVAVERPLPEILGCALALSTGVALALDSPPGVISVREANVIVIGTFCGATMLLLAVVVLTAMLCRHWQRIGVRILGSWIAASAILVLTLRLAR
jgi:hydrogenase/urease accessory protein HupE